MSSGSREASGSSLRHRTRHISRAESAEELDLLESDVEGDQFGLGDDLDYSGVPRRPDSASSTASAAPAPFPGFLPFLWTELSRGYALENDEARYAEKRRKVYAFARIPRELERFLFYGFLQCTDAFLYFFTFLPLRFVMAASKRILCLGSPRPSEICDLLKVIVLAVAVWLMLFVDTSFMYHLIRGQAVIKLYIFYNMLEVADKLFSSFGQDILDALFWTATEPGRVGGSRLAGFVWTVLHLGMAVMYVGLHTLLVLFQATTLSVAFNSHNKALLTIMLSNNFVELKGSVFKKFAKSNLFQMACSDVRERFHYVILLSIVIVRNMTAVNWKVEHFWEMCPDLAMIIGGEFLVDWLKHAFITKFNEIPYEVYRDFTTTIAYDVAKSRQKDAFSDHSDQVSRRMGFIPLPLSVLLIRILLQSFTFSTGPGLLLLGMAYVALVTLKVLNSIVLLGKASQCIQEYERMQESLKFMERLKQKKKARSLPSSPRLSLIDFTDIMSHGGHEKSAGFTIADVLQNVNQIESARQKEKQATEAAKLPRSRSVAQLESHRELARRAAAGRRQAAEGIAEEEESHHSVCEPATEPPSEPENLMAMERKISAPETRTGGPPSVPSSTSLTGGGGGSGGGSPKKAVVEGGECESLRDVDRYTLVNNERIES